MTMVIAMATMVIIMGMDIMVHMEITNEKCKMTMISVLLSFILNNSIIINSNIKVNECPEQNKEQDSSTKIRTERKRAKVGQERG